MDWPSHLDPFLYPNCKVAFTCDLTAKNNLSCTVLQVYRTDGLGDIELEKFVLSKPQRWEKWLQDCEIFSDDSELIPPSNLPTDGVCILFIPRAADVRLPGNESTEAGLADLPISQENWDKISKAFYLLPGHIVKAITRKLTSVTSIPRSLSYEDGTKDTLWMHTSMTSTLGPDTFALASTHVDCANLTLAIMIGCSIKQIKRVQELLQGSEDAIKHPLLMLGICAELHLDRLKKLVKDNVTKCLETTRRLEATRRQETESLNDARIPKEEITWDLINQVRARRDESKRAEEEVKATKRQLAKALPPALSSLVDRGENNGGNGNNGNNYKKNGKPRSNSNVTTSTSRTELEFDKDEEVTNMFSERFADIFAQFEGLTAECRISVEEMSFTADIIRSELARQEAKTSGQEAKISTVIAFVAMLYLPMTTTATIFAMPVFQFPNDWRGWRYQSVAKGVSSGSDSTTANTSDLPVFSGYFWIYLGISIAFTLLTIEGWWRFTSREVDRRKGKHWSRYLGHKIKSGAAKARARLHSPHSSTQPTQPTQPMQQAPPIEDDKQSDVDSEPEGDPSGDSQQAATGNTVTMRGGEACNSISIYDMV